MKKAEEKKEMAKSIILIFLFLMTLFFSWQLYFDDLYGGSTKPSTAREVESLIPGKIETWISPKRTIVHFSEDDHGIFYDTKKYPFWTYALKYLKDQNISEEYKLTNVSKEIADKFKSDFSVTFEFNYLLNNLLFTEIFNISNIDLNKYDKFEFSKMTLLVTEGSILFENDEDSYVLKIGGEDIESIRRLANQVIDDGYIRYYPGVFIGSENEIYSPISMNQKTGDLYSKQNLNVNDDKSIDIFASRFFSQPIEMIRKIEDSEKNRIYMYEHSQLIVSSDGISKYYNTINEKVNSRQFINSIKAAARFILEKEEKTEDTFLDKYIHIVDERGNLGYRFFINSTYDSVPLLMHKDENTIIYPYVIDVYGEVVQNYTRYVRNKSIKELPKIGIIEKKKLTPLEVIELNVNRIEELYNYTENKEENRVVSLNNIQKIVYSYYDNCTDEKLIPIWIIEFENVNYAFDMYTGQILFKQVLKK
jgi:hypothetical protein